jgi:hypothetical protein
MKVVLDRKLYGLSAVREAAGDFGHLADISVKSQSDSIEVKVENIDEDMGPGLVDEFLNFVLALTIANRG